MQRDRYRGWASLTCLPCLALSERHESKGEPHDYAHWIRQFIVFHHKRHPAGLGGPEISAFLAWLAVERRVASSTQNQALTALVVLYKNVLRQNIGAIEHVLHARIPIKVPVVLSTAEVRQLLAQLTGLPGLIAGLLYSIVAGAA